MSGLSGGLDIPVEFHRGPRAFGHVSSGVGGQEHGVKALEKRAGTEPHGTATRRPLGEEEPGKVGGRLRGQWEAVLEGWLGGSRSGHGQRYATAADRSCEMQLGK